MNRKPIGVTPAAFRGLTVTAVLGISHNDGELAAIRIVVTDGTSILITVWTDWSLRIERTSSTGIPTYLWPPEDFVVTPVISGLPAEGLEISSFEIRSDSKGVPMAADLELGEHRLTARSYGGDLALSVNR